MDKIYTFADTKKAVSINSEEALEMEAKNYQRFKNYMERMYGTGLTFEYSPRYTGMLTKWHEDYLKHKKWVQDFKNTKYSSFNDVARWHIAKEYELWIPSSIIESSQGLMELENKIEQIIKVNKEVR